MPLPTACRPRLLATLAAVTLVGCQAVAERAFQQPTIAFRGAALRNVGPSGGVVDVQVLVHNPNPYPLHAERATYRLLTADSLEVGRGEATDSLAVPARDSAVVRLPVAVTWDALARAGVGALATGAARGAVEYRIVGEVRMRTPVGSIPIRLDAPGRARLAVPGLGGGLGGLLGR
jgi:LEA14-like dessication related protein